MWAIVGILVEPASSNNRLLQKDFSIYVILITSFNGKSYNANVVL